ncbi:hypothetical protein OXX80_013544, partial [Metschnikowia pulcherrima]
LIMAGADHVVSMDLHASQMQGFFTKPVDNLYGAPTLARWIRHNISDWGNAVVVSKNPGGTKRVTALADSLKINFAMIHTDRRRTQDNFSKSRRMKATSQAEDSARNIVSEMQTARVVKGHVVDDDYPASQAPQPSPKVDGDGLGGSFDATNSDDEDEPVAQEKLITLVGDVHDKVAIILDDMVDKPNSFISAAEHFA